jgi:hypothetical protein
MGKGPHLTKKNHCARPISKQAGPGTPAWATAKAVVERATPSWARRTPHVGTAEADDHLAHAIDRLGKRCAFDGQREAPRWRASRNVDHRQELPLKRHSARDLALAGLALNVLSLKAPQGAARSITGRSARLQGWVVQRRPVLIGVGIAEGVRSTGCGRAEHVEVCGVDGVGAVSWHTIPPNVHRTCVYGTGVGCGHY